MKNTAYYLETNYQQPLLLQDLRHFIIYIDESISYQQYEEKMRAHRFITAFYVIENSKLAPFNHLYQKQLYPSSGLKEKKSNLVSDRVNQKALKIAGQFMTNALICERNAYDYSQFGEWKKNMYLTLELVSYILPIKQILEKLKEQTAAPKMLVDVVIDRTSQNNIDPCRGLNEKFLQKMIREITVPNLQFEITYQTADSKTNYGIQAADMLAGAYRKERLYQDSDSETNLIPFTYENMKLKPSLKDNPDFLKVFGELTFEQLPNIDPVTFKAPQIKDKNIPVKKHWHPLNSLLNFLKSFKHPKKLAAKPNTINNLQQLNFVDDNSQRVEIVVLLKTLNKHLKKIALHYDFSGQNFITSLSKKVDTKHYQKTIANLLNNVKLLTNTQLTSSQRRKFNRSLHDFNRAVDKYI
ncbi:MULTISPECIES: DUF3800 domain-containing protein [Lactobacillus]|uniref:DUF3800 domain-containing protein n=1 Tax=Lactobacillus xujianguonis TaxID=2495899 RepID=A0A437SY42_9LACO|nr:MULTISPECIES: DUF3800 domain-containing protein [Lactobacillus]RVU71854.1 DUF3800 domain-containing protein [Lactobacillus xujianguonis]RVU77630.1 DUF3800 domain-containing protein [Lactobacillus xujianguonis]